MNPYVTHAEQLVHNLGRIEALDLTIQEINRLPLHSADRAFHLAVLWILNRPRKYHADSLP